MPEYNDGTGHVFAHKSTITFRCANCGTLVSGATGCLRDSSGKNRFCGDCAGIAEALAIGARLPVFLYESKGAGLPGHLNRGTATSWTGAVMGHIVHKSLPPLLRGTTTMRKFGAARFQVRMLDGSLWYGHGPTSNGTYIRLRPMKGE